MPAFDAPALTLLLVAVLGYLLGTIAAGLLISRVMGLGDLRKIGSGNIGATNVLRTGNKGAAALTLLFDALKGVVAVLLGRMLAGEAGAQIGALFAVLGHCWPVWLGFKGGKGVATFLGVWLALAWPVGLACCATWAAAAYVRRISSLAALTAAASSTLWALLFGYSGTVVLALGLTALVFSRHSANIARLRAGTEPKIGQK
ncbi:glycerol-3-phosphate 1-O-acyltransferase PlsY [Seohaeicola zhoushanensis]|uniref:Glycerol-3-phosphate acyltransferase n=1 Tax=Seohaeicola zhoushanensis TaxID=1569283 RepID=A0A8J3M5Q2_9RHOB|nr:glycerol-3-phosphate 1-O-acyltransferase PlsY [Seohaeicola zhoushanensis]GHF37540.1 glycerol-3-phosphate acyltransferase [Seohaeicola zhoushanensis]